MHDYYVHRLQTSLPLKTAETIVDEALKAGGEAGLLPLTVAVLDVGGNIVLLKRQDGSGVLRADIAIGKAWGALGMGISSRTIRDRLKDRPAFQSALAAASHGRFIPVPGGVLALNGAGEVIGAVGISGDASDKDEYAAITGVQRAGLKSHPERPAENWRDAATVIGFGSEPTAASQSPIGMGRYREQSKRWAKSALPQDSRVLTAAVANADAAGYIADISNLFSRASGECDDARAARL